MYVFGILLSIKDRFIVVDYIIWVGMGITSFKKTKVRQSKKDYGGTKNDE